jgi:GGDEF domain-containing protein
LLESIERNTHLRHEAENSLLRMAQYDFLTGLPNRQQLQQQLDKILVDAGRCNAGSVLCVGWMISRASTSSSATRPATSCCWPWPIACAPTAVALAPWPAWGRPVGPGAGRYRAALRGGRTGAKHPRRPGSGDLDHQQIRLRATIGITLFPEDGDSTEKLLQKAEQTMTLAKTARATAISSTSPASTARCAAVANWKKTCATR